MRNDVDRLRATHQLKAQYRGKKKASILTLSHYGAPGLACPAHHPKGSRHLANWWRYIKRQVWGGEAWRVEVGEGKKAWERLRRGQDDTSMSAPRRKMGWTASRSSHTLTTLLLPCLLHLYLLLLHHHLHLLLLQQHRPSTITLPTVALLLWRPGFRSLEADEPRGWQSMLFTAFLDLQILLMQWINLCDSITVSVFIDVLVEFDKCKYRLDPFDGSTLTTWDGKWQFCLCLLKAEFTILAMKGAQMWPKRSE